MQVGNEAAINLLNSGEMLECIYIYITSNKSSLIYSKLQITFRTLSHSSSNIRNRTASPVNFALPPLWHYLLTVSKKHQKVTGCAACLPSSTIAATRWLLRASHYYCSHQKVTYISSVLRRFPNSLYHA